MAENQPSGTLISVIRASYADGRSSKDVQYFISYTWDATGSKMQPALFQIDRHRGVVSTRRPLDRERASASGGSDRGLASGTTASGAKYVVDVFAVDLSSGPFPLSIKTQMNIYVLDRNDEAPVFTQRVYTA